MADCRLLMTNSSWMEQVVQEMISFEELKEMRISGKKADKLRPGGQTLEAALEAEARRENLNIPKVRSPLMTTDDGR